MPLLGGAVLTFMAQGTVSLAATDDVDGPASMVSEVIQTHSTRDSLNAEIERLRAQIGVAVAPSGAEIEHADRSRDAASEVWHAADAAARQAIAKRDSHRLVLAAAISRVARSLRHRSVGPIHAQRLRSSLAHLGATTRWHIAEAETRIEVGQRLRSLARSAERRARRLHDDQAIAAERRRDLEMRLGSAELALGRIPPPPIETAPAAVSSAAESGRRDLLVAYEAHATPASGAAAEAVAPGAGPADGAYGDVIDDLGRLALLAPDADPALLPFVAPLPLASQGQWPISGEVTRSFDEEGLGPLDRGLTFASDLVQPVRAARAGTIVFAGPFMSFGLLLIVDHGHEYHSLLAGMAHLDVRVGDVVVAGQAVGSIAGSEAEPARLYLELRHNGRPVNPLPWLAAREDKVRG